MSGDFDIIQHISKEIRDDPNKPVFDHLIDVNDEVECELAMHEADFFVENYLERFRSRFKDSLMFQSFVRVYQRDFRAEVKEFIHRGRQWANDMGFGADDDEGDDDGGV